MTAMNDSIEKQTESNNKKKSNRSGLFVIAIFVIGMIFFSRQEAVNTIDCTPDIIATKPDVIMLGAWWCSYCYKAKKYFQKNKIHYCEYDMENTVKGKRLYEKHGGGAVPIILIGKYQLSGFNEQQIEAALDTLKGKN
ncbi:hypothetical protein MNBD_GAMMA06-86 [hydrothermal vent metagenome]|uniref:Glutaredoxin domain-containing protein n=1 Tax=hydrothermal vent metagenome TaxID=652676 RepID=A0A3B0WDV9_9ZZZZ